MAETRDLIVRSNNIGNTKSFIRIGDESPLSVSETGSSLQFLQNLSSSLCTFDTAGTTSAFRIRHDTVNGYLIFEGRSGSNGPYQLMTLNDDTNTVTFGGTVAFEDISFDQITGSHLYVGTSSILLGTTSISFLSMTSSLGTASIWYDGSTEGVQFPDGLVIIGSGSTPGGLKFQDSTLRIYTHSDVMGNLYVQGLITANDDIYAYGDITSSGAKIGSGTGYVSSSAGVYSTKGGSAVMDDLGKYRTITINGTSNEVQVSPGAQNLSANRTWTIGLPNNVKITNNLTIGDNVASDVFSSGFGGSGFAISQSNNRYIAQFDDLWVRGAMNVYQMVINQIRATNGSLWISDASKAISASYDSTNKRIVLRFQTGSLIPFIAGDILRSKRWGLSGSTTQSQWDITTTVSAVNYATGYVTLSAPTINNLYTVTGSANGTWTQLAERLSNSGSQWVRVGNTTTESNRDGSIYITSNDLGGPFLDVYDNVTSSVQATGGSSNSVNQTKTKVRLGQLSGIYDSSFGGNLSGYGLYADNVYLKGTISATAGTFSGKVTANEGSIGGWSIEGSALTAADQDGTVWIGPKQIQFVDYSNGDYLLIGTKGGFLNGFGIGYYINGVPFNPYFKVDRDGAFLSGSITASAGQIGGWNINDTNLTSSGIALVSGDSPEINIGAESYGSNGIWLGKATSYKASFVNGNNKILFDGTNIGITTSNFTLSNGAITSTAGTIGGWNINSGGISSTHSYGTVSITKSGISNLSLTDTYGNFTYSAANSNLYISSVNKYLVDYETLVDNFNRYESGITISQANPNQGFGVQINHLFGGIVPLFVFTVSGLTSKKEYILQSRLQNLTVEGWETSTSKLYDYSSIYCWITPTIDPWQSMEFLGAENPLWCAGSEETNNLVKQYRMTPTANTIYLWVGGTMAPIDDSDFSQVAKFTFSGFRIDSFKQYTELSQKGLLVFNSPENYLQLSSENDYLTNSSKASLGLLNVAELHVNGTSINDRINNPISVFNGGTGTNSFANHQFLWYDTASGMIQASGFSSSSGGGSGMTDYSGPALTGNRVISQIAISSGVMTTASRALTAANIGAAASSITVTGTGLLDGGGNLTTDRTITHKTVNGAYHLPTNGSAGQLLMRSGTEGSGSWTSNIQTTGTASFASITASAGFTSSTGNIAVGGSITSSQAVKAKYFNANPNLGYKFDGVAGSIKVDLNHGTALDLQDFSSLKIGHNNDYGTSSNTFLQGMNNEARGDVIHIQGCQNSGFGDIIHIEGFKNQAEVNYGHTQGYQAIGHITGSKTFANGSMDGNFPHSTTQVSTIVLYAYGLRYDPLPLINQFYPQGVIDFNRAGLVIDNLHISFFLNVMITYDSSGRTYAYQQTFTYNNDRNSIQINAGAPYGDVSATAQIPPQDLGEVRLVQDDLGMIHFSYTPTGREDINSVIVKVEMIEHIVYTT